MSIFILLLHIHKSAVVNSDYKHRTEIFSKKLKAGKRRTYFFDVRSTRNNDYFLTITESKKTGDEDEYERHKIFLYKEDMLKFLEALQDTIDHIRTELLPDYDFEANSNDEYSSGYGRDVITEDHYDK